MWDAKASAAVGNPGHIGYAQSIAYSPNWRTIQIRDADTGAGVGKPLEGLTFHVLSVLSSPDGRCIVPEPGNEVWDSSPHNLT